MQSKSQIRSIGIDLGKTTFHLVALGSRGQVVVRRKFSRQQLLLYTANLPSSLIGMEACVGSHFLGRALREQGHEVRLIPAQFVRPFVKSNKNDYRDAEAIAEAVERENMRFVPIKTEDQLDVQALHRVRERLVSRRTSVINQIRAFLLERGISFAKGPASLRRQMPEILENADQKLTTRMRRLLDFLWQEWKHLQLQIESLSEDLEKIASSDEACIRLQKIPEVGPLVATAVVSAIGNGAAFKKGREFSAWLGLVPGQWSTGGKTKLFECAGEEREGPTKRDLRTRLLTLISCLFAGPCPGPDLARSAQGVAADPAESRPGAAAGCPALSGGFLGMDLVGLIAGPIVFRYPFLSLLFDEACDVRWPTRDAHGNDVVASRP
jgi:transposase